MMIHEQVRASDPPLRRSVLPHIVLPLLAGMALGIMSLSSPRAGECGLADERPRFILHLLHVGIGDRPYVGRQ